MTAEPLPPRSSHEEGAEEDLESRSGDSREHLQSAIPKALAALRELETAPPELRAEAARLLAGITFESGRRLRLVGRARKVSVSMPEDLTAAVQRRVGRGEFSQYVTEAVARQLDLDLLGELSALLEAEHGPISDEALTEARNSWPDAR
jgi:Arc/MetJ-type ribon-helix-helix transcriptional regulator